MKFSWTGRIRTYKFSLWQQIYSLPPSPVWILPNLAEDEGFEPPHRISETTVFKTAAVTQNLSAQSSNIERMAGFEPAIFRVATFYFRPLRHILKCGEKKNRTFTAFTRNTLAECLNKPIFDFPPSTPNKIRTYTLQGLNLMPLPIGLLEHISMNFVHVEGVEPSESFEPKSNGFANLPTHAYNKKASRNKSRGFTNKFIYKSKTYHASYHSITNNLIRDYCMFLLFSFYKYIKN